MPDTCWCKHVKDTHKVEVRSGRVWLGECMSCSCAKFAETRPARPVLPDLPPLPPKWSAPLSGAPRPQMSGDDVASSPAGRPETAPSVEVPDGRRSIEVVPERVEGPAPAEVVLPDDVPTFSVAEIFPTPLEAYDAFMCASCGSRAFERWTCCQRPMKPVRVEIHAREVSDG